MGSFGGELAINSIIGSYYLKNFPHLGQTGSGRWAAMFGLLNVFFRPLGGVIAGLAVFMDAANGANFAVVPHVHPFANGILSGIIGATGNLGGIIFAIIFRYNGKDYAKVIWIIGAISIGVNVAVGWIRPVPKNQIGGQ